MSDCERTEPQKAPEDPTVATKAGPKTRHATDPESLANILETTARDAVRDQIGRTTTPADESCRLDGSFPMADTEAGPSGKTKVSETARELPTTTDDIDKHSDATAPEDSMSNRDSKVTPTSTSFHDELRRVLAPVLTETLKEQPKLLSSYFEKKEVVRRVEVDHLREQYGNLLNRLDSALCPDNLRAIMKEVAREVSREAAPNPPPTADKIAAEIRRQPEFPREVAGPHGQRRVHATRPSRRPDIHDGPDSPHGQ